ncbi:STAS-like domain-containing protein [Shewanella algae]|uniref:STAS-like domain-containing protein n=1 Tax=Shewanella algae TaxID=38313 RepID=UPI0031F56D33
MITEDTKKIVIVTDFHPQPYGRYRTDGPGCEKTSGEVFRETILAPALRQHSKVEVDLTGYNRYGRSFLDEAFGGLIREEGFTKDDLDLKLVLIHSSVQSILKVIQDRIEAAEQDRLTQ